MYDKDIDVNNPMFDLNRKLIQEQKDIIVITQDNISEKVMSIIKNQPTLENTMPVQTSLLYSSILAHNLGMVSGF